MSGCKIISGRSSFCISTRRVAIRSVAGERVRRSQIIRVQCAADTVQANPAADTRNHEGCGSADCIMMQGMCTLAPN